VRAGVNIDRVKLVPVGWKAVATPGLGCLTGGLRWIEQMKRGAEGPGVELRSVHQRTKDDGTRLAHRH
jgi:hypothetical protein